MRCCAAASVWKMYKTRKVACRCPSCQVTSTPRPVREPAPSVAASGRVPREPISLASRLPEGMGDRRRPTPGSNVIKAEAVHGACHQTDWSRRPLQAQETSLARLTGLPLPIVGRHRPVPEQRRAPSTERTAKSTREVTRMIGPIRATVDRKPSAGTCPSTLRPWRPVSAAPPACRSETRSPPTGGCSAHVRRPV